MRKKQVQKPEEPKVGPCRPVFKDEEDTRKFFDDFREAVAPDLEALRKARIQGYINLWRGIL